MQQCNALEQDGVIDVEVVATRVKRKRTKVEKHDSDNNDVQRIIMQQATTVTKRDVLPLPPPPRVVVTRDTDPIIGRGRTPIPSDENPELDAFVNSHLAHRLLPSPVVERGRRAYPHPRRLLEPSLRTMTAAYQMQCLLREESIALSRAHKPYELASCVNALLTQCMASIRANTIASPHPVDMLNTWLDEVEEQTPLSTTVPGLAGDERLQPAHTVDILAVSRTFEEAQLFAPLFEPFAKGVGVCHRFTRFSQVFPSLYPKKYTY